MASSFRLPALNPAARSPKGVAQTRGKTRWHPVALLGVFNFEFSRRHNCRKICLFLDDPFRGFSIVPAKPKHDASAIPQIVRNWQPAAFCGLWGGLRPYPCLHRPMRLRMFPDRLGRHGRQYSEKIQRGKDVSPGYQFTLVSAYAENRPGQNRLAQPNGNKPCPQLFPFFPGPTCLWFPVPGLSKSSITDTECRFHRPMVQAGHRRPLSFGVDIVGPKRIKRLPGFLACIVAGLVMRECSAAIRSTPHVKGKVDLRHTWQDLKIAQHWRKCGVGRAVYGFRRQAVRKSDQGLSSRRPGRIDFGPSKKIGEIMIGSGRVPVIATQDQGLSWITGSPRRTARKPRS